MNYKQIYDNIINYRLDNPFNGYTEKHHILPRSLGGCDDKSNLVELSAREHYICHLLLTKIYPKGSQEYYKMIKAYNLMANANSKYQKRDYNINSKLYESLRLELSKAMSLSQSGKGNSQYKSFWVYNPSTLECKKVPSDFIIKDGWFKGRVTNWDTHFSQHHCEWCNKKGLQSKGSKYCSDKCKDAYKPRIKDMLEDIVIANTIKNENDCWIWQKSFSTCGYPQQFYENKNIQVHRYMYGLKIKSIDVKDRLKHICNDKRCCNPNHLIVRSQSEINRERVVSL